MLLRSLRLRGSYALHPVELLSFCSCLRRPCFPQVPLTAPSLKRQDSTSKRKRAARH